MNNSKPLVIVDICGTLFNSNTTFDFLDFFLKNKSYVIFRKISKTLLWRILNKTAIFLISYDLTRTIAVKYLKGKNKSDLDIAMATFYKRLIDLRYENVFSLVNQLKLEYRVILASATLDFIAKKIAQEIGVHYTISTELGYDSKNFCNGKIKRDLLGKKLNNLKNFNLSPPFEMTITDNLSDIDLLVNSKNSIIITKKNYEYKWQRIIKSNSINNHQILIVE